MQRVLGIACSLILSMVCDHANAQLFAIENGGRIGEFDVRTGAAINGSFITGLSSTGELATDGNGHLFMATPLKVEEFDAATGAVINPALVTITSDNFLNIAADRQGNLYLSTFGSGIGKYNASTGATISAAFITTPHAYGLAVADGYVYTATDTLGTIGKYDAATGTAIDPYFARQDATHFVDDPVQVAVSGTALYVSGDHTDHVFCSFSSVEGSPLAPDITGGPFVNDIATGPDGTVYVSQASGTSPEHGVVLRYDPVSNSLVPFLTATDLVGSIAVAPEPTSLAILSIIATMVTLRRRS